MKYLNRRSISKGKLGVNIIYILIWLAFLDIVIFGLNSDSPHCLTHMVVSWIIIIACVVIIMIIRKKGHRIADR